MRITYLNFEDLVGRRFNGYDLARHLNKRGHECNQFVWYKSDDSVFTHRLWDRPNRTRLYTRIMQLEQKISLLGQLYPFSLFYRSEFRDCDVLHVHLIAQFYFNIFELILLSAMKPLVITMHDLSFFSGRCVHPPDDCDQWITGCLECPDIPSLFPVRSDRAHLLWKIRQFVYKFSNPDVVVSSKWMLERVNRSPMLKDCKKHLVPFGLDLDVFRPLDKDDCKRSFGICPSKTVIMFRALNSPFKGLDHILEALRGLDSRSDLCIVSLNEQGYLDEFKGKFHVLELGLLTNEHDMARVFGATDIFLMPSINESFGMMAMEATACGVPSIVTEDTPLPDVAFAPDASLAVPRRDSKALIQAIETLLNDPARRHCMGMSGRKLAEEHYPFSLHARRMLDVYDEAIDKHKRRKRNE